MGYSPTLREIRTGNKKQETRCKDGSRDHEGMTVQPLTFRSLLSLLSYTAKDNISRCDDAHSGLGPITLIIKHGPK